jgi:hypothetical protein
MTATRSQAYATARFAVPGEPPRPLQFGCQALLDGRAVIRRLARELPAVAADLIEIAACVYAVDRLVQRPTAQETRAGSTWAASYRTSSPAQSTALQAMLWQVARMRACLAQPHPWLGLVSEFPEILDTAPLTPTEVISLYRSYVQEWESLEGASGIGGQLWQQGRTAA